MSTVRVPWSSATFLVYLGGLIVVFAAVLFLATESDVRGAAGYAGVSLLVLAAFAAAAFALWATGHAVTAGLFSLGAVIAFVVLVAALLTWFGWLDQGGGLFEGFRFWLLVVELAAVAASAVALSIFRFPLLTFPLCVAAWFFVTDLVSGGGNWSAIVTIAVGLVLLLVALAVDDGLSKPYAFWPHVAAAIAIGGGIMWLFHDSDFDWIVIAVAGFVYVAIGDRLSRSSWAVIGAYGILQSATYFAGKWSDDLTGLVFVFPLFFYPYLLSSPEDAFFDEGGGGAHVWAAPLVYAVTGLLFVAVAWLLARRRHDGVAAAAEI